MLTPFFPLPQVLSAPRPGSVSAARSAPSTSVRPTSSSTFTPAATPVAAAAAAAAAIAPTPASPGGPKVQYVKALHKYDARQGKELSVKKGELLRLLNNKDKSWWKVGRDGSDESGYVPSAYVKIVEDELPAQVPASPSASSSSSSSMAAGPRASSASTASTATDGGGNANNTSSSASSSSAAAAAAAAADGTAEGSSIDRSGSGQQLVAFPDVITPVATRQAALANKFEGLKQLTQSRSARLQEALKFFQFKRQAEDMISWIKEQELQAASAETGKDLEQVTLMCKKFDNFKNDLSNKQAALDALGSSTNALQAEGNPYHQQSVEQQQQVQAAWNKLNELTRKRSGVLKAALEVEQFNRQAEEARGWMSEKNSVIPEDLGRDLNSVQRYLREQDGFNSELHAIEFKVKEIETNAGSLSKMHPAKRWQVAARRAEIMDSWEKLQKRSLERQRKLSQAYALQEVLSDYRDSTSWIDSLSAEMNAAELPSDVTGAEAMLQHLQQLKAEMDARQDNFDSIKARGEQMVGDEHYAADDIKDKIGALDNSTNSLRDLWEKKMAQFTDCYKLRVMERDGRQLGTWMETQEAVLANPDTGNSLDEVLALIKAHDDFHSRLQAHAEKVAALKRDADSMVAADHYASPDIAAQRDQVAARYDALLDASTKRQKKLQESLQLQALWRDCDELDTWMKGQLQKATDGSYRDPSNLDAKLEDHVSSEAEIAATEKDYEKILATADAMVAADHYSADDIEQRVAGLSNRWETLRAEAADKGRRLREARDDVGFSRQVKELNDWCGEVEQALKNKELGKDLISAQNLLKRAQQLAADVDSHRSALAASNEYAQKLVQAGNFKAESIGEQQRALNDRVQQLLGPVADRVKSLEESVELQQWYRDMTEEDGWVRMHEPAATSQDLPESLTSALNMNKKHQVFHLEVTGHEALINAVLQAGEELTTRGHYAKEDISTASKVNFFLLKRDF